MIVFFAKDLEGRAFFDTWTIVLVFMVGFFRIEGPKSPELCTSITQRLFNNILNFSCCLTVFRSVLQKTWKTSFFWVSRRILRVSIFLFSHLGHQNFNFEQPWQEISTLPGAFFLFQWRSPDMLFFSNKPWKSYSFSSVSSPLYWKQVRESFLICPGIGKIHEFWICCVLVGNRFF